MPASAGSRRGLGKPGYAPLPDKSQRSDDDDLAGAPGHPGGNGAPATRAVVHLAWLFSCTAGALVGRAGADVSMPGTSERAGAMFRRLSWLLLDALRGGSPPQPAKIASGPMKQCTRTPGATWNVCLTVSRSIMCRRNVSRMVSFAGAQY